MKARVKSIKEIEVTLRSHDPDYYPPLLIGMLHLCEKTLEFSANPNFDTIFITQESDTYCNYMWSFHKDWLEFIEETPVAQNFTETPSAKIVTCNHNKKYKNHAGGILFWYCPSCKSDLGNV